MTAEEFLQKKDIWNHPYILDRTNSNAYELERLLDEFSDLNSRVRFLETEKSFKSVEILLGNNLELHCVERRAPTYGNYYVRILDASDNHRIDLPISSKDEIISLVKVLAPDINLELLRDEF
jgi:hypothetical protein